jgi:hypothetical protein
MVSRAVYADAKVTTITAGAATEEVRTPEVHRKSIGRFGGVFKQLLRRSNQSA